MGLGFCSVRFSWWTTSQSGTWTVQLREATCTERFGSKPGTEESLQRPKAETAIEKGEAARVTLKSRRAHTAGVQSWPQLCIRLLWLLQFG